MASMKKGSRLTYADFEQLPEEVARRHELIDGELVEMSAPTFEHQVAVGNLHVLLRRARPRGHLVLVGPFDWKVDEAAFHPDVLVAPIDDFTPKNLPVSPLLAVEVLSPSNQAHDLVRKRHIYAKAGLTHYWIVDPDVPSVMFLERSGAHYVQRDQVEGDDTLRVGRPFEVELRPSDLLVVDTDVGEVSPP